jgi:hypothetical protein
LDISEKAKGYTDLQAITTYMLNKSNENVSLLNSTNNKNSFNTPINRSSNKLKTSS